MYFHFVSIIVLLNLILTIQSAEWMSIHRNTKFPGKCSINSTLILNQGVSIKDPYHKCRQIVCGHNGLVIFHSCGVSFVAKNCHQGDYLNSKLPYPQCCQRAVYFFSDEMFFAHKVLILQLMVWGCLCDMSLNYYGDNSYPGRCVLDVGSSVILLKMGQSVKLDNLPCVNVFCIGDGYGMLYTCERAAPPDDCRFTEILDWDAAYPECCKRRVICD